MEWEDYLMPDSNVLKNKLDLYDQHQLNFMEKQFTDEAIENLTKQNITDYSAESYKAIHREIFKEVYPEDIIAGVFRQIDMEKRERILSRGTVEYHPPEQINDSVNRALSNISQIDFTDKEEGIKALARESTELWLAHPFREGNTRTLAVFIKQVANSHNIHMDFSKLGKVYSEGDYANTTYNFRDSLVYAYKGSNLRLDNILKEATTEVAQKETIDSNVNKKSSVFSFFSSFMSNKKEDENQSNKDNKLSDSTGQVNQASSPSRKLK